MLSDLTHQPRVTRITSIDDAVGNSQRTAANAGVEGRVVELINAAGVRRLSPTPFGTFALLLDGELVSYHYLLEKDLLPILHGWERPADRHLAMTHCPLGETFSPSIARGKPHYQRFWRWRQGGMIPAP